MKHCQLCGWSGDCHDATCPEVANVKPKALAGHRRGWEDGRAGKSLSATENGAYKLGWIRGTSALEEAENGYDPCSDE